MSKNDSTGSKNDSGTWRLSDIDLSFNGSGIGGRALKIQCITWNVGNEDPTESWPAIFKCLPGDLDMLVIGLQESTFNIKDKKSAHKNDLLASINHTKAYLIGALQRFRLVKHCYRAQMQLYVFAEKELCNKITDVQERIENTGILHIFPNKGGLLISMQVDSTKLAFISCHLAAHEGVAMCELRNSSIHEILGGTRVWDERFDVTVQSHHTFFMGDMNYRVTFDPAVPKSESKKDDSSNSNKLAKADERLALLKRLDDRDEDDDDEENAAELLSSDGDANLASNKLTKKQKREEDRKKVLALITAESWGELLAVDELSREVAAGRALSGFTPAVPAFPPTFKRRRHQSMASSEQQTAGSRKWNLIDADVDLYSPPENPSPTAISTPSARPEKRPSLFGGSTKKTPKNELEYLPDNHVRQFYDSKRIPSYTDRVLTRSLPRFARNLILENFVSVEEAKTSDHKPVKALFTLHTGHGAKDILVEDGVDAFVGDLNALSAQGKVLEVVFSNMKGHNLAEMDAQIFGGGSDPFIIVSADPHEILATSKEIKSSVVDHNLNPDWGTEELVVPLLTKDLDGLSRHAHIFLSVWDYDKTKQNDLIGLAAIPMREIIDAFACGQPSYSFHEPLLSEGLIMGHLSATASIRCKPMDASGKTPSANAIREAFDAESKKPLSDVRGIKSDGCGICSIM